MTEASFYPNTSNLFLDTMDDLYRRARPRGSEYDAVQVAGLLRRLLCDGGSSLIHHANREPALKSIRFEAVSLLHAEDYTGVGYGRISRTGPYNDPEAIQAVVAATLARPEMWPLGRPPEDEMRGQTQPRSFRLKEFLALHIGGFQEPHVAFTVLDMIKAYANQLGGIHHEPARRGVVHEWIMADEPSARDTVLSLGRITYRGLLPLAQWHEWNARGARFFGRVS